MAKYKDTAELEYKGVDNLSNTIKSVNKRLEEQQDRAKRTEDRIDKYTDRMRASSATIKQTSTDIQNYSKQLERERAAHKANIDIIADAVHKRDQLNQELNQARAALNNLSKEEKENVDLVKRKTAAVKKADEAYLAQKKVVLNLKDDQTKLNKSINETERAQSKASTAQERAKVNVEKMNQAINEQEFTLKKQSRAIRESNVEILDAGNKTFKTMATFVKLATVIEDTGDAALKYGRDLNKLDAEIDKAEASIKKLNRSNDQTEKMFNDARQASKKAQQAYDKYSGTIKSVTSISKKLADTTSKVGAAYLKFVTPIKKVTSGLSSSKSKTDKQSSSFNKLDSSAGKANQELTKTNSLLGKISKLQTIKFGISMAQGAVNSLRMFFQAGQNLSEMLIQNDNITRQYNASLGDQTKVLDELYESELKYLGVSYQETQQTASRIAQQAENYNMTKEAAAGYAVMGTELASVLSVTNLKQLDMEQSSERLISALRGEAEAAELLGLNINATKMEDFTEKIKERGAAVDGSFRSLDTATQAEIRMMAAVEQTAVITGTAIDPIYDLETANIALNKILLETGDSLTEEQKAALKWKIAINEIKQAFRGFGVPLMNAMGTLVSSVGGLLIKLKPLIAGVLEVFQWLADKFSEVVNWIIDKGSELVDRLTPYFQALASFIEDNISPVLNGLKRIFNDLWTVAEEVFGALTEGFASIGGDKSGLEVFQGALQKVLDITIGIISKVGAVTSKLVGWVKESGVIEEIIATVSAFMSNYIIPLFGVIGGILKDLWSIAGEIFDIIANGTSNTNILSTALGVVRKIMVRIFEASLWVWTILGRIVDNVREWLVESGGLKFIIRVFSAIAIVAKDVFEIFILIWDILKVIIDVVVSYVVKVMPVFLKIVQILGYILLPVIMLVWKAISAVIKIILTLIKIMANAFAPVIKLISTIFVGLSNVLWGLVAKGFSWVYDKAMLVWDLFGKSKLYKGIQDIIQKFKDFYKVIYDKVNPYLEDFGLIMDTFVIGPINSAIETVKNLINWFKDLISIGDEAEKKSSSASLSASSRAQEIGNKQRTIIDSAVRSSVNMYGDVSKPIPVSSSSTSYNSTRNNVSFTIAGGYRKSLASLQRDAQVLARRKGVPLR